VERGKSSWREAFIFSGPRKDRPFAPVDCSALVSTLIESELFGYVKGAFTGAVQQSKFAGGRPGGHAFSG